MGVLVAGGTGALGTAVVRELLDAGYACTAHLDRRRASASGSSRVRRPRVARQADLSDPEAARRTPWRPSDDLEAVVNLVGGFATGPRVHETEPADFERMIELNLAPALQPRARGDAAAGRARRRRLRRRLRARRRCGRSPAPPATWPARPRVLAFVQALDAEYKDDGVRCNAILPSVIDTPANREAQPDAD